MIRSHFDLIGFDGKNLAFSSMQPSRLWKHTRARHQDVRRKNARMAE